MTTQEQKQDETKTEEPTLVSALEEKIIRQIEYYFGDVNMSRDRFLKEKIKEDDGWITLECLTTFNRLKMLSTDLTDIAAALKKSKSGLMEIHETDLKVRRSSSNPLADMDDPMVRKASKMKTLYMKGFPDTYNLDNVQEFFKTLDVSTVFVKMRKDDDYKFKGSIYVEFKTLEEAKKLLNDKDIKCGDVPMKVMTREEYFQVKKEERRKHKEPDQQAGEGDENQQDKTERKAGTVLHFKGVGEGTRREDLKALFGAHEPIAWVDFNQGETQGFIRFEAEGAAQKAIDGVKAANDDGKIMIKDTESTVRVIEGEEEENYWKMVAEDKKKQKNRGGGYNRGGGRGRGRGRGGRKQFGGKRRRPWEDRNENNKTDKDIKPSNEHKRFDDNSVKDTEKPVEAKKTKVESED